MSRNKNLVSKMCISSKRKYDKLFIIKGFSLVKKRAFHSPLCTYPNFLPAH